VARAALALEDGTVYFGESFGAPGTVSGEVCFNTSMTGYQEILTDPSYRGQILTMTAPQIGNYGVNPADVESGKLQMAGFVVREASRIASNFTATGTLGDYLAQAGVVGLAGIDTRALVRRLRIRGAMTGVLSSEVLDEAKLVEMARQAPPLVGRDLVREVMPTQEREWTEPLDEWAEPLPQPTEGGVFPTPPAFAAGKHVVALDYGMKWNIARHLASTGCRLTVLPGKIDGRRRARSPARRRVSFQWPGRSGGPRLLCRNRSRTRRQGADVWHLPGPPAAGAGLWGEDVQAHVWPSGSESAGDGPRHRHGGDHVAKPWLRRR
jgi:carbamoyl-phosphate synthase small subunit